MFYCFVFSTEFKGNVISWCTCPAWGVPRSPGAGILGKSAPNGLSFMTAGTLTGITLPPHPPHSVLPVQLRESGVLPGWERVGRRQSRDFPPPAHPGLRSLAWCPSQPLDLWASRGLQGPPAHNAWGSPARLPLLSTPNWQLLLGSCSRKLPSDWNHPRSPSPGPPPTGQARGGAASGRCCRAGGSRWVGLKAG